MSEKHPVGAVAPHELDSAYWDQVSASMESRGHYLDQYLASLKMRSYLELVNAWLPDNPVPALKTDLFEESTGVDALLWRTPIDASRLYGMDVSTQMAARAAAMATEQCGGMVVGDARHLPFASGSLGFVLSPSTLDHFEDTTDLHVSLVELRRVLRPGGSLLITLANRSNVGDPLRRLVARLRLAPYYVGASYTIRRLRSELERAGFEIRAETAIVHHPRMMGVAFAWLTRICRSRRLAHGLEQVIEAMQQCKHTRWRYATGCFIAALAIPASERNAGGDGPVGSVT